MAPVLVPNTISKRSQRRHPIMPSISFSGRRECRTLWRLLVEAEDAAKAAAWRARCCASLTATALYQSHPRTDKDRPRTRLRIRGRWLRCYDQQARIERALCQAFPNFIFVGLEKR